jgi:hypothetical protein
MAWGGRRANAGRPRGSKNRRTVAKVPLSRARAHRQNVDQMPLDVLVAAMRDETLPIELRLAAAWRAGPYYHAKVSPGPPKAAFEMSDLELKTAIAREKEHQLRAHPGQRQFQAIGNADND